MGHTSCCSRSGNQVFPSKFLKEHTYSWNMHPYDKKEDHKTDLTLWKANHIVSQESGNSSTGSDQRERRQIGEKGVQYQSTKMPHKEKFYELKKSHLIFDVVTKDKKVVDITQEMSS